MPVHTQARGRKANKAGLAAGGNRGLSPRCKGSGGKFCHQIHQGKSKFPLRTDLLCLILAELLVGSWFWTLKSPLWIFSPHIFFEMNPGALAVTARKFQLHALSKASVPVLWRHVHSASQESHFNFKRYIKGQIFPLRFPLISALPGTVFFLQHQLMHKGSQRWGGLGTPQRGGRALHGAELSPGTRPAAAAPGCPGLGSSPAPLGPAELPAAHNRPLTQRGDAPTKLPAPHSSHSSF